MTSSIHVYSEIGKLKTVMLHRPSKEPENLSPEILNRMLIDDIPYLKIAQKEHDYFAKTLQKQGIHVVYLDPMPNVYFTRDQQAAIGNGMTINRMTFRARRRESLFMKTILKHHPDLEDQDIPVWRDRYHHG